uniref:Uncharacterized protein n=1 Tax=Heterorhabditis bacteriophora TaxID=37862 RepID=A0A1I7WVW4_HETBA
MSIIPTIFVGGIYNVKHLYIIGSINIESLEGAIFKDSFIDEIIFEDVSGQLDSGFLLGARVYSTVIRNSNLHFKSQIENYKSYNYTGKSGFLLITNTSLNVLIPLLFADFYSISLVKCEIGQIQNSDSLTSIGGLRLNLEHTLIGSIEPYALGRISIHNLSMHHCLIVTIKKAVVSGSQIGNIVIADSQLKMVSELAFADSTIGKMEFKRSHIEQFMTNAFGRARIGELEISKTRIDYIGRNLFILSIIRKLQIEATYIKNIHPKPFERSQVGNIVWNFVLHLIDSLNITQCDFGGTFGRDFFEGLAPARFSFTNSTLNCDPDDCELNSLLLKPPSHDLSWKFTGNTCRSLRGSNICSRPSIAMHPGLTCRFSWLLADCICTSSRPKFLSPNRDSSITALYLFRIGKCEIRQMPRNVKTVKIYNSNNNTMLCCCKNKECNEDDSKKKLCIHRRSTSMFLIIIFIFMSYNKNVIYINLKMIIVEKERKKMSLFLSVNAHL